MRVGAFLKWVGVSTAALAVIAVAVAYSIDVSRFRGEIVAGLEKATGRDVRIGGEIALSPSLRPELVLEDLAIANTDWGSRPWMLTLKRVEAKVALIPLITGALHVTRLVLIEPDLLLEISAEGMPNWDFDPPGRLGAPDAAGRDGDEYGGERRADDELHAPRFPFFERIEIHRARLAYGRGPGDDEMRLELEEATASAEAVAAPFLVDVDGTWNRAPFSAKGSLESLERLALGTPVALDLQVEFPGFATALNGVIAEPVNVAGLDVQIVAGGEDLSTLAALSGADLPEIGLVDLNATLRGSPSELQVDDIRLTLGRSDVAGNLRVSRGGARPAFTGSLTSKRIHLAEILSPPPIDGDGPESAGAGTAGERAAQEERPRFFSDEPLPFEGLKTADLDLVIGIDELATPSLPVTAVELRIMLDDGALAVEPASASVAGSRIEGALRLDARGPTSSLSVSAAAASFDLGEALVQSGLSDVFRGTAVLRADLEASGASVAALMAGLDGDVKMLVHEGRLKTRAFDVIAGGATALLGTLFSGRREWTVVNCAASFVEIRNGVASSQVMLIDTPYSTVIAEGNLDLATETLDLSVEPRAKAATLNIAVPVRVKGTLSEPTFQPDPAMTLKKVGGLVGIALFPPVAVAGLGELGNGDNECIEIAGERQVVQGAPGSQGAQALPLAPEQAVEKVIEGAKGVVEGIGDGLKSLFGATE